MNSRKTYRWMLVLGAVVAGSISLCIGLHQSVWFDEAYSILLAKHSVAQIFALTGVDTHPPLFYLMLKGWAFLFGWSEFALRILSVLSMVGALLVGGALARKMFGHRTAIGVIAVLALSPLLLRYGFEIRMYAFASLVGIAATYCLYSATQAKAVARRYWLVGYALLVAIGVYTLYYLAFLWIAHVVWLMMIVLTKRWRAKKLLPYVYSYCGAVLLFIPWLPTFIRQMGNDALAPIGQPMNFEQISGVASFNVLYHPSSSLTVILTVLFAIFVAAVVWALVYVRKSLAKSCPELLLLVCYIGVPIVILMVISLTRPMYTERYLSHVAIGLMMLIGVIVATALHQLRRHRALLVVAVFAPLCVGVFSLMAAGNFNFQRNEHPTVNQVAATLANCAEGTQLVAADPYVATEMDYYLPNCQINFVSQWDTLGGGYAPFSKSPLQIKDASDLTSPRVTYVYYGTPDQVMPDKYSVKNTLTIGTLTVTEYQLTNAE